MIKSHKYKPLDQVTFMKLNRVISNNFVSLEDLWIQHGKLVRTKLTEQSEKFTMNRDDRDVVLSYRWRRSCCLRPKLQCEETSTPRFQTCCRRRWWSSPAHRRTNEHSVRPDQTLTHGRSHSTTLNSVNQFRPSWSWSGWGPGSRPAVPARGRWWVPLGWCGGRRPPAGGVGPAGRRGKVCGGSRWCRPVGADTAAECEPDWTDAGSRRPAAAAEPPGRRQGPDGPPLPPACCPASGTGINQLTWYLMPKVWLLVPGLQQDLNNYRLCFHEHWSGS